MLDERPGFLRVPLDQRDHVERPRLKFRFQAGGQGHGTGGKLLIDVIPRDVLALLDLEDELFLVRRDPYPADFLFFLFPLPSGGVGGQLVRRPRRGERRRVAVKVTPLEGAVRLLSQAPGLDVGKQLGLSDFPAAILLQIGERLFPILAVLSCVHRFLQHGCGAFQNGKIFFRGIGIDILLCPVLGIEQRWNVVLPAHFNKGTQFFALILVLL